MSAGGLASAVTGMRPTRVGAIQLMAARSRRTSPLTCGRWTLTTTGSPVFSVAPWTWAMEAAATGISSNVAKTASSGRPRSVSTV